MLKPKVRNENSEFTGASCQKLIVEKAREITPEVWRKACEHAIDEERRFGDLTLLADNQMDSIVINDDGDTDSCASDH